MAEHASIRARASIGRMVVDRHLRQVGADLFIETSHVLM